MNNDAEIVSVFCLAYNHEKYIRSALEGFVNQKTNFRYVVYIHDDASTDNTAQIIKEFADKYPGIIKPIFQHENQLSKRINITRTYLYPLLRGKYIACCEGDDYWTDEYKLQKQYDALEKNKSCVLCTHVVQCSNEDDTPNSRTIPSKESKIKSGGIVKKPEMGNRIIRSQDYLFHTSSYFYRRELIETDLFKEMRGKMNGDQTILYCASFLGDTFFINEKMSVRRLMTIGNYHQRYLLIPKDKQIERQLKFVDGRIAYDELTNKYYHKHIVYGNYVSLMKMVCKYRDDDVVIDYYLNYKKNNRVNMFFSFKLTVLLIIFKLSPNLFKKIMRL